MSTVNSSAPQLSSRARASSSRMKPRSRTMYSWNQNGAGLPVATSSSVQAETVDKVNGTPAAAAARAACTSPRRAFIPASPIGPSITGMASVWPNSRVWSSMPDTSRSTRWRSATCAKSATFRRSVSSANEPPSIYSNRKGGSRRRASSR